MLNRLKRIWELSKYDAKELDLTTRVLASEGKKPRGKAGGAFLEDMTDEQYVEWERDQDSVWKKFMDRARALGTNK